MFNVEGLRSGYGEMSVLKDLTFDVGNEIFAVLGANGAGKSTLLKTLARLLPLQAGKLSLDGKDVSKTPAYAMPGSGVAYVPQEGNVFPDLSVQENLSIGGRTGHRPKQEKFDEVFDLFPRLKERRGQSAGSLSGGEGRPSTGFSGVRACRPRSQRDSLGPGSLGFRKAGGQSERDRFAVARSLASPPVCPARWRQRGADLASEGRFRVLEGPLSGPFPRPFPVEKSGLDR